MKPDDLICLLLLVCTSTSDVHGRVINDQSYDGGQEIKADSPHIREKRVGLGAMLAAGRKALRRLLKDSVEDKAQSTSSIQVYVKRGTYKRAEEDFDAVIKTAMRKGTYLNGHDTQSVEEWIEAHMGRTVYPFTIVEQAVKQYGTDLTGLMEYKIGQVGDKIVTLTKDGATGKATIDVTRKAQCCVVKKDLQTKIIYRD